MVIPFEIEIEVDKYYSMIYSIYLMSSISIAVEVMAEWLHLAGSSPPLWGNMSSEGAKWAVAILANGLMIYDIYMERGSNINCNEWKSIWIVSENTSCCPKFPIVVHCVRGN